MCVPLMVKFCHISFYNPRPSCVFSAFLYIVGFRLCVSLSTLKEDSFKSITHSLSRSFSLSLCKYKNIYKVQDQNCYEKKSSCFSPGTRIPIMIHEAS